MRSLRRRGRRARHRLLALGALPVALMQCAPQGCGDEAWKANYPAEPQFTLRHDFSLSPGLEPGKVTSCIARGSQVDGRAHLCRVVEGHEAVDDFRNWLVDGQPWESDPIPDSVIIGQSGEASSSWGISIVTSSGEQFEGCNWYAPTGDYFCDYKVSRQTVLKTSGEVDFVLRKFWDWTKYVGAAGECGVGVTGVWGGAPISAAFLLACADGPL